MKVIRFTDKEFDILKDIVLHHPCESGCNINPTPKYDCNNKDNNGNYKCPIQTAYKNLVNKIIIDDYEKTKIKA